MQRKLDVAILACVEYSIAGTNICPCLLYLLVCRRSRRSLSDENLPSMIGGAPQILRLVDGDATADELVAVHHRTALLCTQAPFLISLLKYKINKTVKI